MIPFNKASLSSLEYEYLSAAINRGHISGCGPFTRQAEDILTEIHGQGRSLLTTSCTHALELSALLLNLKSGDEVIVPSYTFVSTASAFALHGATPVFADIDPMTLGLSLDTIERVTSERTKAVCVVHYAGFSSEIDRIADFCSERDIVLIEDNAHGFLGTFRGRPLGTFGSLSTLSFHETKNITCGEGGALHINDLSLLERSEILREKGTDRSRFFRGQVDKYTWVDLGSSWVLSDLLAAVLVGQLERREEIQNRRHQIWNHYYEGLADWAIKNGVEQPKWHEQSRHPAHMYYLLMPSLESRSRFIEHLKRFGVLAVFHYQALHRSRAGQMLGRTNKPLAVSEKVADTLVRLPLFRELSDHDLTKVVSAVLSFET